jgi:hypothetical protein
LPVPAYIAENCIELETALITTSQPADRDDVASEDAIIKAFYESASFLPAQQPDYDRLRTLFHPQGHLIPPKGELGPELTVYGVEAFITRSREHVVISGLERGGFSKREIDRQCQSFGAILHVFSRYESRPSATGTAPIERGLHSMQLLKEDGRWWVVSVLWEAGDISTTGARRSPGDGN